MFQSNENGSSGSEAIRDCAYHQKQNILLLLHKTFAVSVIQLGKLEKRF